MEVSAIEGAFRSTCERVMGVLRTHVDSLMVHRDHKLTVTYNL